MARLGVAYIALCEWLLAVSFAPSGLFIIFLSIHHWKGLLIGFVVTALAAAAGYCAFGLVQQKVWSVNASWIIGIATFVFAGEIVRLAMDSTSNSDGGEAGLLGIAMIVFALPAMLLLALPGIRRYIRSGGELNHE